MKKTLATLAIAALALTGCATTNNQDNAESTATATASATAEQTTAPSETQQAQEATPENLAGDEEAIMQEAENQGVTSGESLTAEQSLEIICKGIQDSRGKEAFTDEDYANCVSTEGLENTDEAYPAEEGEPGELKDHSNTPVQSDEELAQQMQDEYAQYADQMPSEDDMYQQCLELDHSTASSADIQTCYNNYGL